MKLVPLTFECAGETLVGVVAAPEAEPETALLVIVGGPQYRVGSHRQFVQLMAHAASEGYAAMSFDVRGMGDSGGAQRSFESIDEDISAAIDALQRTLPSVKRVGLWGLCGGASAALLYVLNSADPRVAGLALVNPWVRSDATQALTRVKYYYLQRFFSMQFWKKLISGGVGMGSFLEFSSSLKSAAASRLAPAAVDQSAAQTLEQRMRQAWSNFRGPVLLLLSGIDYTAKEFLQTVLLDQGWGLNLEMPNVMRVDAADADHTFSLPGNQLQADQATSAWLRRVQAG